MLKTGIFLFCFFAVCAWGKGISGSFKSTPSIISDSIRSDDKNISRLFWDNSLRLNGLFDLNEQTVLETAYQVDLCYDSFYHYSLSSSARTISDYRFADFSETLFTHEISPDVNQKENLVAFQNLDRLNVQYRYKLLDLALGRMPVNFGSARVVNPTDVLIPISPTTFDSEYRLGVDAVRIKRALGDMVELDLGAVAGKNFEDGKSAYFLNFRHPFSDWYITYTMIRYRLNTLIGLDFQGAINDAGVWLETAYNFVKNDSDNLRFSAGGEYNINSDFLLFVEYHYNGEGSSEERDYQVPHVERGIFLMAKHYITPGISYQLSPLWSLSANMMFNINDYSILLSPTLAYSASDNIYVDLGMIYGNGSEKADEFASYSDQLYASLKYYF